MGEEGGCGGQQRRPVLRTVVPGRLVSSQRWDGTTVMVPGLRWAGGTVADRMRADCWVAGCGNPREVLPYMYQWNRVSAHQKAITVTEVCVCVW